MTAKVIADFSCRLRGVVYRKGDLYEGTPERVAELVAGGYLEGEKPEPKRPARKPKAQPEG